MGVSGTGKSAVGELIAAELGVTLIEGDSHHSPTNVDKMSAGVPLTDEDRLPWLETLARLVADQHALGHPTVLACSALRRRYRDVLRGDLPARSMFFVHLHAPYDLLASRMAVRDHFMPASLLQSQLDTLEHLEDDEDGALVDVSPTLEEVAAEAVASLPTRGHP